MRVVPPLDLAGARLTDTSVAEPSTGETVFDIGDTYAAEDRVISTTAHWEWESAAAGNVGHALPAKGESDEHWLSVGPSNKYRALDLTRNTSTTSASPQSWEFAPDERINTIAVVGIVADEIEIEAVSGGDVVYSYTAELTARETTTWSEYFFGSFFQIPTVLRRDLLLPTDAVVTITLTRATGDVSVSGIILGTSVYLGATETDAELDEVNKSTIEDDDFGNTVLIQRRSKPITRQTVVRDKGGLAKARTTKALLNAVPALWFGLDDDQDENFDALLIVGVYTRWLMTLKPRTFTQQLEIKEV